ncbi:unnamed protein product [Rhizoctonia solani]|uniref:Uncharacterized protein n=1 Tax=Rhizoctonia solani TaxID=456999 RepID=A0A8H2WSZ0_9AGAM|nr:unnamed protein product [Rhizoctonia solani]
MRNHAYVVHKREGLANDLTAISTKIVTHTFHSNNGTSRIILWRALARKTIADGGPGREIARKEMRGGRTKTIFGVLPPTLGLALLTHSLLRKRSVKDSPDVLSIKAYNSYDELCISHLLSYITDPGDTSIAHFYENAISKHPAPFGSASPGGSSYTSSTYSDGHQWHKQRRRAHSFFVPNQWPNSRAAFCLGRGR